MIPADVELDGLHPPGSHGSWSAYARQLWQRRDYAWHVPRNELRSQQLNTALGNLWHLFNPALSIGIYYLIFGLVIRTDRGVDNFIAFLAVGVFTFQFTQKSVMTASRSITKNRGLLRSISFPRALLPITSVITEALAFIPGVVVMFSATILSGASVRWTWILLIPLFALQLVFNIGAAMIAARANHAFEDVYNVLPFLFRLLFYCSGVLFAVEAYVTTDLARAAFYFNPLYDVIALARWAILGREVSSWALVGFVAWSVLLAAGGLVWFRRAESRYGA